jgi:anthranilate phosphoribosyltransferase
MIREGIRAAVEHKDLSSDVCRGIMNEMMSGRATQSQIASFITAMRMKGETEDEIRGFVLAMREHATMISAPEGSVDLCGTGGDGFNTFNIGTVASFVVGGAGVPVAKHGNRSVSSRSGSADVLSALGIPYDLEPPDVEACLSRTGMGFMFAPVFHRSMKNVQGPRREVGVRTFFNILGPMVNPAGVRNQLMGVYDASLSPLIARVLRDLGTNRAMVVNGDGMDELSTLGSTRVAELIRGEIREYEISPTDFGLDLAEQKDIEGGAAAENARTMLSILKGERSPRTDIVKFNAAAALYLSDRASDIHEGVEIAGNALKDGSAMRKLKEFSSVAYDLESERQRVRKPSMLRAERILPETLVARASDLTQSLLTELKAIEGGADIVHGLDEDLLSKPSVLSVLVLNRAKSLLLDMRKPSAFGKAHRRKLSESISSLPNISLIGEYKPRSPSSLPLEVAPDAMVVAKAYADSSLAGASVLIEPDFFGGSPSLFSLFRENLDLPLLFKDFIVTERQVEDAQLLGADAVLLIAKSLSTSQLDRLSRRCLALDLEPLVELHDGHDLEKLLACSRQNSLKLVGINSRDLGTLKTDLGEAKELRDAVGRDKIVIAESGVSSPSDIEELKGFDAALVGSMFMRAEDLGETLTTMLDACRRVAR